MTKDKMVIIRDTREQAGYQFQYLDNPPMVVDVTLTTGDYSIQGLEDQICIERKSLNDAFGTFGRDRRRFERELERMKSFSFRAVVIEADWETILRRPPKFSRLNPKTVLASIIAWQLRYGVHFWPCPDRNFAERITYRMLERYWRDHQEGRANAWPINLTK